MSGFFTLAAVTLMQVGSASDVGQDMLVSAVSASPTAVKQLGLLLDHCGKVQAAAANEQDFRPLVSQLDLASLCCDQKVKRAGV